MILAFTFYTNHLKAPNLGDCKVNHLHLLIYQNISFFHEYPNFDQILYFMWLWHTRVWQGSFSCGFLIDNLSLTLHIPTTPPTFISNYTPYIPPHPHLIIPLLLHEVIKHLNNFFAKCCIWSLCNESYLSPSPTLLKQNHCLLSSRRTLSKAKLLQTRPKSNVTTVFKSERCWLFYACTFYSFYLTWYSIAVDF